MSTEPSTSSPARDLVRIHRIITRGIATVIERGDEFRQTGFPDERLRQGFSEYSRSLATVLDAHHLSEDTILFPAFKQKLPQAPYEKLGENHRQIEALLVPVRQALEELSTPAEKGGLAQLVDTIRKITEIWAPHFRMEAEHFLARSALRSDDPGRADAVGGGYWQIQPGTLPATLLDHAVRVVQPQQ